MPEAPPPVTLPGTECHSLSGPSGEYRLLLAIPPGPPPPGGFPVLYLLDANAGFGTLLDILRQGAQRRDATGIGPAVIAGIAYPGAAPHDRARRMLDYTRGPSAEGGAAMATGGRDAFLAFLRGPVAALVARRAPVDAGRQALIGHSLGGYFVLDVLTHDPAAFAGYLAISPSVWWGEDWLRAGLAAPGRPACRLAIGVGAWEQALSPQEAARPGAEATAARRARRAMVDKACAMAEAATAAGVETRFDLFPEENHVSVIPSALGRGLRFLMAPWVEAAERPPG